MVGKQCSGSEIINYRSGSLNCKSGILDPGPDPGLDPVLDPDP